METDSSASPRAETPSAVVLMKGNEALSEAAIRAGATLYFGYPITPQNEIGEYMSRRLPTIPGGAYIQAETEVASINMVYGAASAGRRAMTSSSSPGWSSAATPSLLASARCQASAQPSSLSTSRFDIGRKSCACSTPISTRSPA